MDHRTATGSLRGSRSSIVAWKPLGTRANLRRSGAESVRACLGDSDDEANASCQPSSVANAAAAVHGSASPKGEARRECVAKAARSHRRGGTLLTRARVMLSYGWGWAGGVTQATKPGRMTGLGDPKYLKLERILRFHQRVGGTPKTRRLILSGKDLETQNSPRFRPKPHHDLARATIIVDRAMKRMSVPMAAPPAFARARRRPATPCGTAGSELGGVCQTGPA
jgi:hypothetical protein